MCTSHKFYTILRFLSASIQKFWFRLPVSIKLKQKFKKIIFRTLSVLLDRPHLSLQWKSFETNSFHNLQDDSLSQQSKMLLGEETGSTFVPLLKARPLERKPVKLICFYLPQFHTIPENDAWWGKGFTEWTNVKFAKSQFVGHEQPRVPGELGYYDLLEPSIQRRQIELATLYGISGFCFYFYWFGGKMLLKKPIDNFLNDKSLDFPFCLCWANENWTRRWDGLNSEILIAQKHSSNDDLAFIEEIAQYWEDPRYIRIQNKPLLIVYRPNLLPSAAETAKRWRKWSRENGIGEIYIAYTQSFEKTDPANFGFDAAIEFPPNKSVPPDISDQVKANSDEFACRVYDWRIFVTRSQHYSEPPYKLFRGVCPSWDNTARKNNHSIIFKGNSPIGYQQWLRNAIDDTCKRFRDTDERLVFLNAWNEWAESAYLEPDHYRGYAYLEATRQAMTQSDLATRTLTIEHAKAIAIVIHAFYTDIFEEIIRNLEHVSLIPCKLFVTTTKDNFKHVNDRLSGQKHPFIIKVVTNRGRDILPFLKIMDEVSKVDHDIVIKVHTKKSIHRVDGAVWRQDLFSQLITEKAIYTSVKHLVANPRIGILGPAGHIVPMNSYLGSNAAHVLKLSARLGVDSIDLSSLSFVAGSMFIARMEALYPLMALALPDEAFEEEAGQIDGTLAHAIERIFAVSSYSSNLTTACMSNSINDNYLFVN